MLAEKVPDTSDPQHTLELVDTQESLDAMIEQLMAQPRVAVDTEANSLYAYQEQVCLVQISIPEIDYLVDPFALDLVPLKPFFESAEVEKIFHAADYDLIVLLRDFGFETQNIFDTMWAARVLGWPKVGLADLLETYFGVKVNKRYQRYNWGKRPLDPEALRYAWMDSHYLLDLREIQKTELEATGRWTEAHEIFDYLTATVEVPPADLSDRHFWRVKGSQKLNYQDLKRLYAIYRWRERTAEKLDRPPMKVLSNRKLFRVSQAEPRNRHELASAGLSPHEIRRYGDGILRALRDLPYPNPPEHPRHERPPDAVMNRYKRLKAWRKQVARNRGVDSDVILPNAVLWTLAENPPQSVRSLIEIPGIGPWRREHYGRKLVQLTSR